MRVVRIRSVFRRATPWLVVALALSIAAVGAIFERPILALLGLAIAPVTWLTWKLVTLNVHEMWRSHVKAATRAASVQANVVPTEAPVEGEPGQAFALGAVLQVEAAILKASKVVGKRTNWLVWFMAIVFGVATLVIAVLVMPRLTAINSITLDQNGDGEVSSNEIVYVGEVMLRTALALTSECAVLFGLFKLLKSLRAISLEQKYIAGVLQMNNTLRVGLAAAGPLTHTPQFPPGTVPMLPEWLTFDG